MVHGLWRAADVSQSCFLSQTLEAVLLSQNSFNGRPGYFPKT